MGGRVIGESPPATALRLTRTGQIDPSLDGLPLFMSGLMGRVLVPMADGRVVVVDGHQSVRLLPSGALDRTFGKSGHLV